MLDPLGLARFTAPKDAGAAFSAWTEGGFVLITPLTPRACAWLVERTATSAQWAGEALVVEPRYFPEFADAIIAAGFLFEREPLKN